MSLPKGRGGDRAFLRRPSLCLWSINCLCLLLLLLLLLAERCLPCATSCPEPELFSPEMHLVRTASPLSPLKEAKRHASFIVCRFK